ncbi:MAG: hypothetical protein K6G07_00450 [Lachnospiraceae bacterium]|nr:hypothetical protein [Lachnospiraceae bacterium]
MIAENDKKRREALERLLNEMGQLGISGRLVLKGEEGSKFDLLVCAHDNIPGLPDGAVGQYFFPGVEAAEDVFYFTCMVTIKGNLSKEEEKAIRARLDEVNAGLVCGQFEVFPQIGLIYKLSYPLPEEIEEDALFRMMDMSAAHCVAFVTSYTKTLLEG